MLKALSPGCSRMRPMCVPAAPTTLASQPVEAGADPHWAARLERGARRAGTPAVSTVTPSNTVVDRGTEAILMSASCPSHHLDRAVRAARRRRVPAARVAVRVRRRLARGRVRRRQRCDGRRRRDDCRRGTSVRCASARGRTVGSPATRTTRLHRIRPSRAPSARSTESRRRVSHLLGDELLELPPRAERAAGSELDVQCDRRDDVARPGSVEGWKYTSTATQRQPPGIGPVFAARRRRHRRLHRRRRRPAAECSGSDQTRRRTVGCCGSARGHRRGVEPDDDGNRATRRPDDGGSGRGAHAPGATTSSTSAASRATTRSWPDARSAEST